MFVRFILGVILLTSSYAAKASKQEGCNTLDLAKTNLWSEARKCSHKQHNQALDKLVNWLCYQNTNCDASFEEISNFINANPSFPDIQILTKQAEERITMDTPKDLLIKWFKHHKPLTATGIKYYTQLIIPHIESKDELAKTIKYGWIKGNLCAEERRKFLLKYGDILSIGDHIEKVNTLLSKGNRNIDSDILNLLPNNHKSLIKARISLINNQNHFARIIQTVPQNLSKDPWLLHAEAQWHKHKGHHHKLANLLYDNRQIKELGNDSWFRLRTETVAELMDAGNYKFAYAIAKEHNYQDPVNYVDGEWLAGRLAYFYLQQPKLAIEHFNNILKHAKFSVSKSKGAYWSGMAARKMKNLKLSEAFFSEATKHPDTFYGQLAITHRTNDKYINLPTEPIVKQQDLDWFEHDDLIKAAKLLIQNKQYTLAEKFMKAAIQHNTNPARILLVVRMGYNINIPRLSVTSGKEAARNGLFLAKHIYPTLKFSPKPNQIEKALMLSIIRQESAFDHTAMSSASAMGLMQIIYPTAKDIGKELSLRFRERDLINNPRLNLTFGCHHLSTLIEKYDGSYILAAAAYNAGPGNANKWILKYGDPRKLKTVEQVVSWIEKIPFYETRGYIHNVLANIQIYRGILENNKTTKIKVNLDKDLLRTISLASAQKLGSIIQSN
ncbi:MAG: lytic transglycosylase domain-containing protein [Alphaproteobacteria bacterium]